MKVVTPSRRARARSRWAGSGPEVNGIMPPRWLCTGGRGRSPGRSKASGKPASSARQNSAYSRSVSPLHRSRSQTA